MTQRNPNTVGQIYRLPEMSEYLTNRYDSARLREGDLILCLKHTGDCHYSWGRLIYTTQTQSTYNSLPVDGIRKYYDIDLVFSGYAVAEEWGILSEPMTYKQITGALVAMHEPGTTGILLPLSESERAEYETEKARLKEWAMDNLHRDLNRQQAKCPNDLTLKKENDPT